MAEDDDSILGETRLYRRLHPTQLLWDGNQGRIRATTNAFKDYALSVNLEDALDALGQPPEWTLRLDPAHQLGAFTTAFARGEQQKVWREPLVGHQRYGNDPTHGIVEGPKPRSRRTRFVSACVVTVADPNALPEDLRLRLGG